MYICMNMSLFMFIGVFTLPVSALRNPPPYLRVREVKNWYVDYLATLLTNEDAEDLTAPFMLVVSVDTTAFQANNTNSYTYEV